MMNTNRFQTMATQLFLVISGFRGCKSSNNLQLARSGVQGDFDGYSNGEANPDIGI